MAFKILWYSIPSLHDNSNGAAIRCKLMLEKLVQRGIEVRVVTALAGDDEQGMQKINQIVKIIQERKLQTNENYMQFNDSGIEYFLVPTISRTFANITAPDQQKLYLVFTGLLEQYQPDLVMGYSGDLFSTVLWSEAKARKIPVAYALCNGLHAGYAFPNCDLVFTTSKATCQLYKERDDIEVQPVGNFIESSVVVAKERIPEYITLINPSPQKGLGIFIKLAQAYHRRHPEQKFLVVKSLGNYQNILMHLHYPDNRPATDIVSETSHYISVAEHTNDIRCVYALTKVLVAPSLWHESWGRVATEANFNGIPVLGTNGNGLKEAIADQGGILLDAPESCRKDLLNIPSDEEIAPWVDALERLVQEDWTEQCKVSAQINNIESSVDRLLALITPLMEKGRAEKRPTEASFYLNRKAMQEHHNNYLVALRHQEVLKAQQAAAQNPANTANQTASVMSPENNQNS